MALNFVYFDLETERLAEEVGGWTHIEKLGMAVGVLNQRSFFALMVFYLTLGPF